MRKCLRCGETMSEGYMLKTENITAQASVMLGKGKVKAAVCSNCGEISLYFDKIEKIE